MSEEKERITHYDGRERELQETIEIQNLSKEVMRLVDGMDSSDFSAELIEAIVDRHSNSLNGDESSSKQASSPTIDIESSIQPGAFHELATGEPDKKDQDDLTEAPDQNDQEIGCLQPTNSEAETETSSRKPHPVLIGGDTLSVVAVRISPEEEEERVRQRVISQAVQADVVGEEHPSEETEQPSSKGASNRKWILSVGVAFLVIFGLVVGLAVGLTQNKGSTNNSADKDEGPSTLSTPAFKSTLQAVRERDVLRCGSPDAFYVINFNEEGERIGFEVDLCKAFAAGILGNRSKYEIVNVDVNERFITAAGDTIDLYFRAAPTTGRDVHEVSSGVGFTFSVPYVYGGVAFGGKEFFVECADELNTKDECSRLMVCTAPGTTHTEIVEGILPSAHILKLDTQGMILAFVEGRCNVIIGNVWDLVYVLIKQESFGSGHTVGKLLTNEAISFVTRDDDPEWSDMVNWMLQSLMEAEKLGITQKNAEEFKTTAVFGDEYKNIFRSVIGAVGNYAEVYDRHLESTLTRAGMLLLNTNHTSGILWTPGFQGLSESGPEPITGGDIERISRMGYLVCGITDARPGFAEFNSTTEVWSGLDVDFCRAVGSSVFGLTSYETIRFVEYDAVEDGYEALTDRSVDILCGQRVTLGADVSGYGSGEGGTFSLPYFYNEGDDNRALATGQSDPQWSSFVYWIVASTIYAEQENITMNSPNEMPVVNLFGSRYRRMFRDAILAVGNYQEMYDRNLERLIPRSGLNLLNVEPVGPQIFPLPFDESVQSNN